MLAADHVELRAGVWNVEEICSATQARASRSAPFGSSFFSSAICASGSSLSSEWTSAIKSARRPPCNEGGLASALCSTLLVRDRPSAASISALVTTVQADWVLNGEEELAPDSERAPQPSAGTPVAPGLA